MRSHTQAVDTWVGQGDSEWSENWLDSHIQRVVTNGMKLSWRPLTNSITQRSIESPILFNIFLTDLDDGLEWTFGRFAADSKLGGMAETSEGCVAIQRIFNRLEKWTS